ncbi:cytochrome ubiquinol oxidase subunit I [Nocardiopsis sp. JB363]|uniref:cytochrome ubiquinol oxidase subunit I n=1 Tax=Nocardiopsis sp. JB363 TaxID=1434837 RepID=UPI00097B95A3|nr:Cytochrome d ubiquinol oxidase subunit I [Nocardiopsis sp. JB363]
MLDLARLQFAITTNLHFVFVALTLGLVPMVAIMQTRHTFTGRDRDELSTRFWGQIYLINYALGIVTGLVLEFQFGMNWSGLSHFSGDVFGAPLAIETVSAFWILTANSYLQNPVGSRVVDGRLVLIALAPLPVVASALGWVGSRGWCTNTSPSRRGFLPMSPHRW